MAWRICGSVTGGACGRGWRTPCQPPATWARSFIWTGATLAVRLQCNPPSVTDVWEGPYVACLQTDTLEHEPRAFYIRLGSAARDSGSHIYGFCSWIQKAGQEAVLPPFVESSYFQNRRVRLKRGDMLHIKACEGAVDTARTCCSTPNQNCIPQREVMRIDTSMGREGIFHMFKVRAIPAFTLTDPQGKSDPYINSHTLCRLHYKGSVLPCAYLTQNAQSLHSHWTRCWSQGGASWDRL